jgi:hypothetical protein
MLWAAVLAWWKTQEQEAKVDKRKNPPGFKRDKNGLYQEWIYKVKCTDGWRTTQVKLYDGIQPASRCWVWCNCPYFKYHCEVALAHRGSSSIINSNGAPPVFTNPRQIPLICKHGYMTIIRVLKDRKKP